MDGLVGIIIALVAIWAALVLVFWLLRPRGVAAGEVIATVPSARAIEMFGST